jgi:hypothetical protein
LLNSGVTAFYWFGDYVIFTVFLCIQRMSNSGFLTIT